MAHVNLSSIQKSYGSANVIKGVDIEINDGEFVVFVGPSGCGKSTLLRMIAGLETISGGELSIDGNVVNNLEPKDRGIAMVFQSYAIFPHMTVGENVGFGLKISGVDAKETEQRVNEAAEILKMKHLLHRRPSQLSGGQRQRVAIGRAIVRHPKVFLFDEPLSNLDASLRMDMRMEIAKLHKQLGATMIYVTHDQVEAMTLADKIVVLKDGLVQQVGAPMELFHNPANRFVASFLGSPSMNFIPVQVADVKDDAVLVESDELSPVWIPSRGKSYTKGQNVELGIRPQYIEPHHERHANSFSGHIVLTERLGTETVLEIKRLNGQSVIACVSQDEVFDIGEEASLSFDPERVHIFAE